MNIKLYAAAVLVSAFVAANLYAFEKPKKLSAAESEAVEAAEEDDAEQSVNTETLKRMFDGKVMLYPADATAERPDVIGIFRSGQTDYLIKLASADLMLQLKELDGKQATLSGKIRNKGKYFVVTGVSQAGAAPLFVRRRGGI